MFRHTREAIEAHLTIVFAALAIARDMENVTGLSIKKIVQSLRLIQQITVRIAATNTPPRTRSDLAETTSTRSQSGSVTHPGGTPGGTVANNPAAQRSPTR